MSISDALAKLGDEPSGETEDAVNWFALGQRLSTVALTTGVSRGAILSYGWPECHKKGCNCHHANEDEVVGLVLKRVGDHMVQQLLANDDLRADVLALLPSTNHVNRYRKGDAS